MLASIVLAVIASGRPPVELTSRISADSIKS
jgi:hypothetical protein